MSSQPSPLLDVRRLTARYDTRLVLRGIGLSADRGEMVGIIGPNGAGKSTLLKAITGCLAIVDGEVRIADRDRRDYKLKELARTIAYVPQAEPTLFEFSVRDVVLMGRHPHAGISTALQDYEAVDRAMTSTDILHLSSRPVTALSGGEHRRVIIARAIAQEPALMLLDEPTAHLDITHQTEVLSLLVRMTRSDGLCAIAALHDLNAASEYCDRLVLLASGRVLADGPPDRVLRSPQLRDAYGTDFHIAANPISARPLVLPTDPSLSGQTSSAPRVHVISGGGTGARVLIELARMGCRISVGVLNRHDTDESAAKALGLEVIHEEPFSPISSSTIQEAADRARHADLVIVCGVPFGHGNIRNLEMAQTLAEMGLPVVLLDDPPIAERDFTGGVATGIWQTIAAHPRAVVVAPENLLGTVRRLLQASERNSAPSHDLSGP